VIDGTGKASIAPNITATTTYYAQSRNTTTNCVSASRTAVTGTVVTTPATPNAPSQNGPKCEGTGITFTAATVSGADGYEWSGSVSGTGSTKISASTAGTYQARTRAYKIATSSTCYSSGYSSYTSATVTAGANINTTANSCGCTAPGVNCSGVCLDQCPSTYSLIQVSCYPNNFVYQDSPVPEDPGLYLISKTSAVTRCREFGAGWHLPNESEMHCLCQHDRFWSSWLKWWADRDAFNSDEGKIMSRTCRCRGTSPGYTDDWKWQRETDGVAAKCVRTIY
jgi:hypothetical protein